MLATAGSDAALSPFNWLRFGAFYAHFVCLVESFLTLVSDLDLGQQISRFAGLAFGWFKKPVLEPFLKGSIGKNIVYRRQLFDISIDLIKSLISSHFSRRSCHEKRSYGHDCILDICGGRRLTAWASGERECAVWRQTLPLEVTTCVTKPKGSWPSVHIFFYHIFSHRSVDHHDDQCGLSISLNPASILNRL